MRYGISNLQFTFNGIILVKLQRLGIKNIQ